MATDGLSTTSTGELGRVPDDAMRVASHDRLGDLYAELFTPLRRYAYSLSRSWADAGDIVQDVFVALIDHPELLDGTRNPAGFLTRAVRNRALNHRRAERILSRVHGQCVRRELAAKPVATNDGDAILLRDEIGSWVDTLVGRLTPIQREVFTLVRLYGLQHTEAARVLGLAVTTVKTHAERARSTLARKMDALGLADGRGCTPPRRRRRRPRNNSGRCRRSTVGACRPHEESVGHTHKEDG